jgi:hypothetical protein
MDVHRSNAMWRMIMQPESCTREDVAIVFFDETTPRDWRYYGSETVRRPALPACSAH